MGNTGLAWTASHAGYSSYEITSQGRVRFNNAFKDLLVNATMASAPLPRRGPPAP
jgi:hypothetical protein